MVCQLKQQNAVVVLVHQEAEGVVLGFELGVLVGEQHVVEVAVDFAIDQRRTVAVQVAHLLLGGPVHKVADLVVGAGNGEQGAVQFAFAHPCQRVSRVEEAVNACPGGLDGGHAAFAQRHAVFLFELVQEGRAGDVGPAVATHLFGQFASALFHRGQGFLVQQLHEVEAVAGAHGSHEFSDRFNAKGSVFKRFHHLAGAKPREHASFAGRRRVFAVLQRQAFEGVAAQQEALHLHDSSFGVGHLVLGRVLGHAHHDVRHLHFAPCLALVRDFQEVVAILRADNVAQLADGGLVRRVFEWVDHLEGREPAQIAAVALHRRVVAAVAAPSDLFEIGPAGHTASEVLDAVPRTKGVFRARVLVHPNQDVAGTNFFALPRKGFFHHRVEQFAIDEVGTGQLATVAREFLLERSHGVHAERFRLEHLQLEVDEQLHVVVQRLHRVHAVAVVFAVNRLKV